MRLGAQPSDGAAASLPISSASTPACRSCRCCTRASPIRKYRPCPLLVKYVEAGWLGRKTNAASTIIAAKSRSPPAELTAAFLSQRHRFQQSAARMSRSASGAGPVGRAVAVRPISRPSRSTSTDRRQTDGLQRRQAFRRGGRHRASRRSPWRRRERRPRRRRRLRSMLMARTSKSGPPSLALQPGKRRHLLAAGGAPGGPEIDQHDLAAPIRELERLAGAIGEGDIGNRRALRLHHEGGERPGGEGPAHRVRRAPSRGPRPVGGGLAAGSALLACGQDQVHRIGCGDQPEKAARQLPRRHHGLRVLSESFMVSLVHQPSKVAVMTNRMWGGRFASGPDAIMEEINASIDFDRRLWRAGHRRLARRMPPCSRARASFRPTMRQRSLNGLDTIVAEIETGTLRLLARARRHPHEYRGRLAELIGAGRPGRLHTARSRNDQVATDFRLWVREAIERARRRQLAGAAAGACSTRRGDHAATVMPGFTHLQAAQPVTFGHHLPGLCRDVRRATAARFARCQRAAERMPARRRGAGRHRPFRSTATRRRRRSASTGRRATRSTPCRDRDFALEFLAAAAIAAMHLSRLRRGDRHLVDAAVRLRPAVGHASPPAPRSCRRSATPTPPSWCAPRPAASSAR